MDIPYLNFDLLIEVTKEGAFSHVLDSPEGTALARIDLRVERMDLREFWRQVDQPHQQDIDRMIDQYDITRRFGTRLFQAVFVEEIRRCLYASLNTAYQNRSRLRLRLIFEGDPNLAHLPWEYLYDPAHSEFLSISVQVPMVRYLNLLHNIRPWPVQLPLRMLVAIPSPQNHPPLHVENEWLALVDTLDHLAFDKKLIIERLTDPTLIGLQKQLRQKEYHAFHFVGRGGVDEVARDGLLLFEDRMKSGRFLTGRHIGTLLADHPSMRFAFLNIRQEGSVFDQNPFVLAAENMLRRGLSAAIATPFEASPFAAFTFIDEFYAALTALLAVDLAAANARRIVLSEEKSASWGAPVCITRTGDGRLFYDPTVESPDPPVERPKRPPPDNLYLKYFT